MSDLDELYQSVILDHDRKPRNYRALEGEGIRSAEGYNPLCGDRFRIMLKVENGTIADAGFQGAGCAISKASASLMTEHVKGRRVEDVERLFDVFHAELTDAPRSGEGEPLPARLAALRGVRKFPMRVKCATLAWHAMREAIGQEVGKGEGGRSKVE
jgi:nitrogen fixation NifU-like protein